MGQINQEPSMEDILASIKRIIAEDSEAVGARAPRLRREAMAAVASSPLVAPARDEQPPAVDDEDAPEEAAARAHIETPVGPDPSHDVLELTSPMPEAATTVPPENESAAALVGLHGLVSSSAAQASRNAFAALSQLQVRAETGQENSLEGLVADLLRPMLREWLDRELPTLVERMVSAEIARLSGRS